MSSKKRVTNNLVVMGSAAVVAVYSAGYVRTAAAADQFAELSNERRVVPPEVSSHEGDAIGGNAAQGTSAPTSSPAPSAPAAVATSAETAQKPVTSPAAPPASGTAPKADKSDVKVPAVTSPAVATTAPAPSGTTSAAKVPATAPSTAPAAASASSPTPATTAATTTAAPVAVAPTTTVTAPQPAPATSPVTPAPVTTPPAEVPAKTAAAPVTAPAPEVRAPGAKWKDGGFYGWGTSRHGDIQAYIEIDGGKISYVKIEQCLTQYSCALIGALPRQVLDRQSPEVDSVSGATQSANAFYYAIVQALSKAK